MGMRATGVVIGMAVAAIASGCSSAPSTSPTTRPATTTTTRAAASASTSRPTVATTTTSPPTTTSRPGTVSLAAGSSYTITGSGCTPGAAVQVVLESSTHVTNKLASSPAGPIGSFALTVTVPATGTSEAVLSAGCESPAASGWTQVDVPIHYTS